MGYMIMAVLLVILLAGFLIAFVGGGGRGKGARGTLPSRHPVSRTEPAADEATPDASVVAKPQQKESARRHTPPS